MPNATGCSRARRDRRSRDTNKTDRHNTNISWKQTSKVLTKYPPYINWLKYPVHRWHLICPLYLSQKADVKDVHMLDVHCLGGKCKHYKQCKQWVDCWHETIWKHRIFPKVAFNIQFTGKTGYTDCPILPTIGDTEKGCPVVRYERFLEWVFKEVIKRSLTLLKWKLLHDLRATAMKHVFEEKEGGWSVAEFMHLFLYDS